MRFSFSMLKVNGYMCCLPTCFQSCWSVTVYKELMMAELLTVICVNHTMLNRVNLSQQI